MMMLPHTTEKNHTRRGHFRKRNGDEEQVGRNDGQDAVAGETALHEAK